MASNPRRKSDAARRANQVIRSRTVLVMLLLGIVTFAVLFWKLYDIQIRQHSVLQEKAIEQQTRSAVVNASRSIMCAWKKEDCPEEDFAQAARREALRMKEDILSHIRTIRLP